MTLLQIFQNTDRQPPRDGFVMGCLEWQRAKAGKGYGVVIFEGRRRWVTHVVWESAHGRNLGPGMRVLHSCDNPPCIEISHLREGTQKENIQEAVQKKRHVSNFKPGEESGHSKLTENQVKMMRYWRHLGPTVWARVLGVTKAVASKAILGRTWRHIPL